MTAPRRVCVIACGMIAREVLAVLGQAGLDTVEVRALNANFHHTPDRIPDAVDAAIMRAKSDGFDRIVVGYADCGTGGRLDRVCDRHGVSRLKGPHCFAFYQGLDIAEANADADMTTFWITDFLARQYEAFLLEPLGLDRHPELRDMYFQHYEKAVYIAQTDDPHLTARAEGLADRLGLHFERRFTGYGDLSLDLTARITT